MDELFLQGDRVGGDHDLFLATQSPVDQGKKIGEGFAGAGSGFGDKVMTACKGILDGAGHLKLLWPVFVGVSHSPGDGAVRAEDLGHINTHRPHSSRASAYLPMKLVRRHMAGAA